MPLLPVLSSGSRVLTSGFDASGASTRLPIIFRRLLRFQQMDFELAAWQLTYLCLSPRRVYKQVYYHKQTHNTWARNDPAMLILICGALCAATIAWSTLYSLGPIGALKIGLFMIFRDFFLSGLLTATFLWLVSNRFLVQSTAHTLSDDPASLRVEWAYAFDVHCNSFVPLFLILYVAQLLLLPVVMRENWVSLLVGNLLYLAAFTQYIYITYLGYNALPFLSRTETLLFPLLPLFILFVVSLLGFSVAKTTLVHYFGS